ncbi:MAG TPA: hypothetical protein P5525_16870, partial [Candidatus Paceibacterota bacterium]|nr:hypothetical protein [Candidatus Paceibacterota bacterium]
MKRLALLIVLSCLSRNSSAAQWVVYEPPSGKANGKHIVLLAGDEEYRSEETMPMFGKLLSQRHGFKCTVLFSQDAAGVINPHNQTNVPGLHLLADADLAVNAFRFRELPDADMKHIIDFLDAGKPMIVIRTATHAFAYSRNKQSPYAKYSYDAKGGGFGGLTVGETWTYHHGDHGKEASRGLVDGKHRQHPILRGVADVFGPTDVYGVNPDFPADATVLLHGLTLTGMNPDDPPNLKKAIMPLVWLRQCTAPSGKQATILCSTIGAAVDFKSEDLRRLIVNASFFLTGLEVPARADATPVGEFNPTYF